LPIVWRFSEAGIRDKVKLRVEKMSKTTRFPLFIDLKDKPVIVFGGGKIAKRRISVLLDFGAKVQAFSPDFAGELYNISRENKNLELIEGGFAEWLSIGGFENGVPFCVLACTNNSSVNKEIAKYAREYNIMVNVCDDAANCDFYFPAIVRKEELVLGISGNGSSHSKVKKFAADLRKFLKG